MTRSPGPAVPARRQTPSPAPPNVRPARINPAILEMHETARPSKKAAARASLPASPLCQTTSAAGTTPVSRLRRPVGGTRYIDSSPSRLKALFAEIGFVNLDVQILDPTLRIS
jgi:hypothetical protein